jgi:hypothetical protein
MPTITEGQLRFDFPNGWLASKFDDWSFYRNQFSKLASAELVCSKCDGRVLCENCGSRRVAGTKGCDFLAIEVRICFWLIEVKDYRQHVRIKVIALADEVALKARDSLAALVAARINANEATEREAALAALQCMRLRVVLHLEQPAKHSKLFPRAIDPADVLQRLKQLIKGIDPHPLVLEMGRMNGVAWQVQGV